MFTNKEQMQHMGAHTQSTVSSRNRPAGTEINLYTWHSFCEMSSLSSSYRQNQQVLTTEVYIQILENIKKPLNPSKGREAYTRGTTLIVAQNCTTT